MRHRTLGRSGIEASVVGLGTWAIGCWMWGGTDEKESINAIHAAIDSGITLIDTAPAYGFGTSEEIVGKAIAHKRDNVVLATKCGLVWDKEKGEFYFTSDEKRVRADTGDIKVYRYLGPESIREEVEASLKRLRCDTIDLYQTHWQDSTTPIGDTMNELMKLKKEGKIKAIGVSNANTQQMDEYRKYGQLDSDQENYSMLDRSPESDLLPYCNRNEIAFLAYSPLSKGLLTGKIGPERVFVQGDQRLGDDRFSVENRKKVAALLEKFKTITDKYDIILAQLAIAWTFHQTGCTHALVGARNREQAIENARAGEIELTTEDIAFINRALQEK